MSARLGGKREDRLRELQFLAGIRPLDLLRLLRRQRADVRPRTVRRLAQLFFVGVMSAIATRPRSQQQPRPSTRDVTPAFIVGHWRSGTSILQRLLACDPQFHALTYLDCAFPHARELRPWFLQRIREKLPETRGFDAFPLQLDSEFEDEFALLKLTLESPLLGYVFPRDAAATWKAFIVSGSSVEWYERFETFVAEHSPINGQGLFKSPTHAFRIPRLARIFPHARFINIVRDPVDVFLSTRALERHLLANNSLQAEVEAPDEELILRRMASHTEAIRRAREELPGERFIEISYDQLCAQPHDVLERLCRQLDLRPFAPNEERFADGVAGMKTNRRRWQATSTIRDQVQAAVGAFEQRAD